MNYNSLLRMLGSSMIRNLVYKIGRKLPMGGVLVMALMGVVFYLLGTHR